MDFTPHDPATVVTMLREVGVGNVEDLFSDVPPELRAPEALGPGLSEPEVFEHLRELASKNFVPRASFLGAGCYYHHRPALVDAVVRRPEFYTSYTPYQAEASQGILQATYEFQTLVARLTATDVVTNLYDGSTALAEAARMAAKVTRRDSVVAVEGIHPEYVAVVATYCRAKGIAFELVPPAPQEWVLDGVAAVFVQSPNFFGEVVDVARLARRIRRTAPKCLVVQSQADPTCLGLLKPPGECGADIYAAEGQALGMPPSFGGPGLGILAAKRALLRSMPGRLVGRTKEVRGDREGFVLTLQAREQHIRREKATSNVCTNQALGALAALVYLLCLGPAGLANVARQNALKANYLKRRLNALPGYETPVDAPTYNEFVLTCPSREVAEELRRGLREAGYLPPLDLSRYFAGAGNQLLVCVTEAVTRTQLDDFLGFAARAAGLEGTVRGGGDP